MRHIVFDTETTGMEAEGSDRIIEIGALELINLVPTGKIYHQYINPERPIDPGAIAVHGITDEMVADKPVYAEIVDAFDKFIGDDGILVAHNAEFDMRFINAEYRRLGMQPLPKDRFLDTLAIARKMFPGAPASLDALCRRYNIDNSQRIYHGALLDAQLLAEVFLELEGGRQPELLNASKDGLFGNQDEGFVAKTWPKRDFTPSEDELKAHQDMLETLNNPIWKS